MTQFSPTTKVESLFCPFGSYNPKSDQQKVTLGPQFLYSLIYFLDSTRIEWGLQCTRCTIYNVYTAIQCTHCTNSRPPELKCSIKLESSMHRRTICSKFSAGKHLWIQAAVTVSHGNVQFGGLVRPWLIIVTHSQIYILGKRLAMLLMRGMMTTFKLTNNFGEPNDYIF